MSIEIKSCRVCSEEVKQADIQTFPLLYNNATFEPKSNIVFCKEACVKRFLIMLQQKPYLLTLYSLYCLYNRGIQFVMSLKASPDPNLLACRQINPTPNSLTLDQFHNRITQANEALKIEPKQCASCFYHYFEPPKTYVTHKIHDIFQFANLGFCDRPCVNRFIGNLDPNYRELFDDYRRVVHHDYSGSFSQDPERLIQHQIITEEITFDFQSYHEKVMLPKPIHTEHYYATEIIRKNNSKIPTVLETFPEEAIQ